jgi:hypothetical protein
MLPPIQFPRRRVGSTDPPNTKRTLLWQRLEGLLSLGVDTEVDETNSQIGGEQ